MGTVVLFPVSASPLPPLLSLSLLLQQVQTEPTIEGGMHCAAATAEPAARSRLRWSECKENPSQMKSWAHQGLPLTSLGKRLGCLQLGEGPEFRPPPPGASTNPRLSKGISAPGQHSFWGGGGRGSKRCRNFITYQINCYLGEKDSFDPGSLKGLHPKH